MTRASSGPMLRATNRMIREMAGWTGPLDAPAIAQLRILATQLDQSPSAALSSSYGIVYRALIKRAPTEKPADELGAMLHGL